MTNLKTNNTIQAFWVALGSLSSILLGIISAAILSRYFSKADYGTYRQILYIYSTLLIIFSAGLPRVFSYFLPRYSLMEGKTIVKKINLILFIAGLIFSIFLYFASGPISSILKNPELSHGLKIFSPIPMLLLPTLGIEGIFTTYKKTVYIAIYNTLSKLLLLIFIVAPVIIFGGNYISALYGWIVASILTLIIAYFFKSIPFKGIISTRTTLNYKDIFSYSIPLVTASLWGIAMKSADQFYISRYFGAEIFAEFSNGFIELPFVTMVTASTSAVLMPVFSKIFHDNNRLDNLISTWQSALTKSSKIIFPLVIFFIVFSKEIMVILFSEQYIQSSVYFRINLFLNFFNIIIFAPLFFSMGKTKLYAKVHMLMAVLMWGSGYIVVQLFYSPVAIAINSTTLNILKIGLFVYLSSKLLKVGLINYFLLKNFVIIFLHGISIVIMVRIFQLNLLITLPLMIQFTICFILYGTLLVTTAKLFKIDYLIIIQPLMKVLKK